MRILRVELKRTVAVVRVDSNLKCKTLSCTNYRFCRHICSTGGFCPAYCEIIVAAKDYVSGRRKPKAKVIEVEEVEYSIMERG